MFLIFIFRANGDSLAGQNQSLSAEVDRLGAELRLVRDQLASAASDSGQGWKLFSCSQCQELGQRANLAPDWLP